MFYVTSKELPTVAYFACMSRAYVFRNLLIGLGYQAAVMQIEKEL
ncbi:hypothetical protein [Carnobacterium sp. TMP28]